MVREQSGLSSTMNNGRFCSCHNHNHNLIKKYCCATEHQLMSIIAVFVTMKRSQTAILLTALIKLLLFQVIRFLWNIIDGMITLFRLKWKVDLIEGRDPSIQCAQVFTIIGRFKFDTVCGVNSFLDFILRHKEFALAQLVLEKEVSLYTITDKHAMFVVSSKHTEIWRNSYGAFHKEAQFKHAIEVILLPLWAFYLMAQEVGTPQGKIIFIANTSRCGSTLLAKAFEETGRCVTLYEPYAITTLLEYVSKKDTDEVRRHVTSVINMTCKPAMQGSQPPLLNVIKITAPCMQVIKPLLKYYTNVASIYLYRDPIAVGKSVSRIRQIVPLVILVQFVIRMYPNMREVIWQKMCLQGKWKTNLPFRVTSDYAEVCGLISRASRAYLALRDIGVPIIGVRYEDLVNDSENILRTIFRSCDMPTQYVNEALHAFDVDSQFNSPLSMNALSKVPMLEPTTEDIEQVNMVFQQYKLPPITSGKEWLLPGTIGI